MIRWAFSLFFPVLLTVQAAAVLWAFAKVIAVQSGTYLPRSSDPLGLQSFLPCVFWYLLCKQQLSSGHSLKSLQCSLVRTYHVAVIRWAFSLSFPVSSGTYCASSSCPLGIRYCPRRTLRIPLTEKHQGLSPAERHTGFSIAAYSLRLVLRSVGRNILMFKK